MYKNIPGYRAVSGDIFFLPKQSKQETGGRFRCLGNRVEAYAVLLYGETLSSGICGMQELMCLVGVRLTEELIVQLLYLRIVM